MLLAFSLIDNEDLLPADNLYSTLAFVLSFFGKYFSNIFLLLETGATLTCHSLVALDGNLWDATSVSPICVCKTSWSNNVMPSILCKCSWRSSPIKSPCQSCEASLYLKRSTRTRPYGSQHTKLYFDFDIIFFLLFTLAMTNCANWIPQGNIKCTYELIFQSWRTATKFWRCYRGFRYSQGCLCDVKCHKLPKWIYRRPPCGKFFIIWVFENASLESSVVVIQIGDEKEFTARERYPIAHLKIANSSNESVKNSQDNLLDFE